MTIAIGCKGAAAGRTGVLIDSFSLDHVHVAVPPAVSASVRAELFLFPAFGLDHRFATLRTEAVGGGRCGGLFRHVLSFWSQSVSTAECFDCILGDTQFIGYLCITPACFAHNRQTAFQIGRAHV